MKVIQNKAITKTTTFGEIPTNTCFEVAGGVYKKIRGLTGDSPSKSQDTVSFAVFLFKLPSGGNGFVVEHTGVGYVFRDRDVVRIIEIDEVAFHYQS